MVCRISLNFKKEGKKIYFEIIDSLEIYCLSDFGELDLNLKMVRIFEFTTTQ